MTEYPMFYNKKILVGDYDNTSFKYTNMVLSKLGFIVSNATTVEKIKEKILNGENYDIIITNNIYKHSSGEELIKELKKIDSFTTPIVIHSISNEDDFKNLGFAGYLKKPINEQEVIDLFNKLLK